MSTDYSFINELLDIAIEFPTTGEPDKYYKALVKKIAKKWDPNHFFLLTLREYSGSADEELIYKVWDSKEILTQSGDSNGLRSRGEAVLKFSPILRDLKSQIKMEVDLNQDNHLKTLLYPPHSTPETNKFWGQALLSKKTPIAFVLASNSALFKSSLWDSAKRILQLSVDKLFYIYQEKNRIHSALSMCAQDLEGMFSDVEKSQGDVLQSVLDSTRQLLEAEKCALFLVDFSEKSLVLERASGKIDFQKIKDVATYNIEDYDPNQKGTGVTPWVLYRKKPFNARNFDELRENSEEHWQGNWDDPMYGGREGAKSNFQCVYMVPLLAGDKSIGVLKYENRTPAKPHFEQSDERIIDIIAELVTNLVVSQRIERNRYDQALPSISETLVKYFGEKNLAKKLLDECRTILNADLASLFIVDYDDNLNLREIVGTEPDVFEKLKDFSYGDYKIAKGLTPWVVRRGTSFNVRNYPDLEGRSEGHHLGKWDDKVYHNKAAEEFKSLYLIPLIIGDEKIGALKVENKNVLPYYFTESDERLFDLIGRLIAIWVNYEKEQYFGLVLRSAEIGFLAAGISHEFNNYLEQFISTAGNMKEINSDETLKSEIESLIKSITKASDTIKAFKEIKNRKQEVQSVNIDAFISQLLNFSMVRFKNMDIDLKYRNEGVETVIINPSELQTIVTNLLKNAFDSITESEPEGKGTIEINIREKLGSNFTIEVIDSGKGISEDVLKHLFTPFFTTKAPKGMGIGLYWVRKIVDGLRGEIEIDSPNEYKGATIRVTLPQIS